MPPSFPPKQIFLDETLTLLYGLVCNMAIHCMGGYKYILVKQCCFKCCLQQWELMKWFSSSICSIFNTGAIAFGSALFGQGTSPILLTNVRCAGSETSLSQCTHSTFTRFCGHYEDAGVTCRGIDSCKSRYIFIEPCRLPWGWHAVAKTYTRKTKYIYCAMHAFTPISCAIPANVAASIGKLLNSSRTAAFGQGTGPILFDNVYCAGSETSLSQCPHSTYTRNCRHFKNAGVTCRGNWLLQKQSLN